jgi:hypothetical protein
MRIVVVLPDPFGPRKPKTMPRGTSMLSESTALVDLKSRVSASVRMIGPTMFHRSSAMDV